MSLGDNIKRNRELQNISLSQFAVMTGISEENCAKIEAGQRALSSSDIRAICGALCISFDALVAPPVKEADEGSVLMPVDELQALLGKMKE